MQKFDTATAITAAIDITAGRIQVIAADRTDTTVEIRPAGATKSRDIKAAEQTTVEFTDGILRITGPAQNNQLFGQTGSVEVTVQLPTGSHVQATAAAAQFRGVGRLGNITVNGAHDETKIDEAATVNLTAHAGDITVGRLTGPAHITTQQGDITIAEATTGTVELTTQQGNLTITTAPGASATLDAGTTYGRVTNTLTNTEGPAAALTIKATTQHGDITARSL
ncbi:hypothetical protein Kfla_2000 [Kribbella flavida DSM 17836]|uniref:DUF4097 domain-containing protein n=1 Tax=Kribbella flavida (strain DSM 17836 / JCM 10339 / NBRC 14399) TaxID=479435 RepID=D2PQV8_KRIFD|nr:DUF4097 family beta strand repeat-containing protein [Kribbella flavida]ADB31091.1 hypothetical protein Kfla_2000 [Kribbella flavida DSM 17836]